MSIWDNSYQASKETFEVLKEHAKYMTTITYKELGARVGLPAVGTRYPLRFIRDSICRPLGIPWLNALAVQKNSWLPGDSFIPDGVIGEGAMHEMLWWRGMVLQVYAFPWDDFDPETAAKER